LAVVKDIIESHSAKLTLGFADGRGGVPDSFSGGLMVGYCFISFTVRLETAFTCYF
jgi:hypothetical protein